MNDVRYAAIYNRYIDITFYDKDRQPMFQIKTPRAGAKPTITVQYKRVPGDFTYNIKLSLTDFFNPNANLLDIYYLDIVLGYTSQSDSKSTKISCEVFYAYRESASPNGNTVFDCIVGYTKKGVLQVQPYELNYVPEASVQDVLDEVQAKTGKTIIAALSPQLLKKTWAQVSQQNQFMNEHQLFSFVAKRLGELCKVSTEPQHEIQLTMFNEKLTFVEMEGTKPVTNEVFTGYETDNVPYLDRTTQVVWTAGTLSVIAPFNPDIQPGGAFFCSPTVYNGSKLPVVVARNAQQKSESNMYYVITQEVAFSTTGDTNSMTLLGVPIEKSPLAGNFNQVQYEEDQKEAEKIIQERQESFKQEILTKIQINVGGTEDPQKIADVWESGYLANSMDDYVIQEGDTLSTVAEKFFGGDAMRVKGVAEGRQFNYKGMYLGYPMILICTYTYYVRNKGGAEGRQFRIDPTKPDSIVTGRKLKIPRYDQYSDLNGDTKAAQVFESVVKWYTDTEKKSWCVPTQNIGIAIKNSALL